MNDEQLRVLMGEQVVNYHRDRAAQAMDGYIQKRRRVGSSVGVIDGGMTQADISARDAMATSRGIVNYNRQNPGDEKLSDRLRRENTMMVGATVEDKRAAYKDDQDFGRDMLRREQSGQQRVNEITAEQAMGRDPKPLLTPEGDTLGYMVDTGNGNRSVLKNPAMTPELAMGQDPTGTGDFFYDGDRLRERGEGDYEPMSPYEATTRQTNVQKKVELQQEMAEHAAKIAEGDDRFGFANMISREKRLKEIEAELAGVDAVLGGGAVPNRRTEGGGQQGQTPSFDSMDAAAASGLPKGTRVMINGRAAEIY